MIIIQDIKRKLYASLGCVLLLVSGCENPVEKVKGFANTVRPQVVVSTAELLGCMGWESEYGLGNDRTKSVTTVDLHKCKYYQERASQYNLAPELAMYELYYNIFGSINLSTSLARLRISHPEDEAGDNRSEVTLSSNDLKQGLEEMDRLRKIDICSIDDVDVYTYLDDARTLALVSSDCVDSDILGMGVLLDPLCVVELPGYFQGTLFVSGYKKGIVLSSASPERAWYIYIPENTEVGVGNIVSILSLLDGDNF